MGLLGDIAAYIDARKRVAARNVSDLASNPRGLLNMWGSQVKEDLTNNMREMGAGVTDRAALGQSISAAMPVSGVVGSIAPKGVISDWRWRPMRDVKADVALSEVPDYIQGGYGQFMREQNDKAAAGMLGERDLLKAYGITRSSVNRGAREIHDDMASAKQVRPEGYFSEWLLSKQGQAYLDDAQNGVVNEAAIKDIQARFRPFGMADTLASDLRYAAKNLPEINGAINAAVVGPLDDWRAMSQSFSGIGPSKSGFLASLLGRGDIPTFDARQIALHTGRPATDASKYIRRASGRGGDAAVDRLANRQTSLDLGIDKALSPFYQHLTHHAVWDKVGGSRVTHDDLIRAMKFGAFGGAGLLSAAYPEGDMMQ